MVGSHLFSARSTSQALIALSGSESEFYAAPTASEEGLGIRSVAKDMGIELAGEVRGDAPVALGIIKRKGLGRSRCIDTGLQWIQQTAAEPRLTYHTVFGKNNLADLTTKYLDQTTCG